MPKGGFWFVYLMSGLFSDRFISLIYSWFIFYCVLKGLTLRNSPFILSHIVVFQWIWILLAVLLLFLFFLRKSPFVKVRFLRKSPFDIHKSEDYYLPNRKIIRIIDIGWFFCSNLHFFHIETHKAWYHTIINIILTMNVKKELPFRESRSSYSILFCENFIPYLISG